MVILILGMRAGGGGKGRADSWTLSQVGRELSVPTARGWKLQCKLDTLEAPDLCSCWLHWYCFFWHKESLGGGTCLQPVILTLGLNGGLLDPKPGGAETL